MKNIIYALVGAVALAAQILPAFAVDADSAVKTCNKNKNCKITISTNGETIIVVNGQIISCPLIGNCQCITCQTPKKSVKVGQQKSIMSVPELLQQGAPN